VPRPDAAADGEGCGVDVLAGAARRAVDASAAGRGRAGVAAVGGAAFVFCLSVAAIAAARSRCVAAAARSEPLAPTAAAFGSVSAAGRGGRRSPSSPDGFDAVTNDDPQLESA